MSSSIEDRIRRVYAAINVAQEKDMETLRGQAVRTKNTIRVSNDFKGGASDDELWNQAILIIHNIANLRDHLRRWAAKNEQDKDLVDQTVNGSLELQIIKDLSNVEKHGGEDRNGGHSKLIPKLENVRRYLSVERPKDGRNFGVTFGPDGSMKTFGEGGTAAAKLTGDVLDKDGNHIGSLSTIIEKGVEAWESLLKDFGLLSAPST
jgi:hypothetical protein